MRAPPRLSEGPPLQNPWIIYPDRAMLFLAAALILTCTMSLVLHDGARRASDGDDDLSSTADVSPAPAPAPARRTAATRPD